MTTQHLRKALVELGRALDGEDATYLASLRRRAYAAIRSGKKMRMDAVLIEIDARIQARKNDQVARSVLRAAKILLEHLFTNHE